MPPIMGMLLLYSRQASHTDLFPYLSDETYYWHQGATFAQVGFEGGYYTADEVPPPATFSRYYAWGLFVPMLYGTIGHVTGWPLWAIPAINIVIICIGLMVWIGMVRPRAVQMLIAGVLLFTYSPFITYGLTSTPELLHMTWGIVIAGSVFALHQRRQSPNVLRWLFFTIALVMVAAGFRVTWGILLPVVAAMGLSRWGTRGIILGGALGVLLAGTVYGLFFWTAAPYPGNLEFMPLLRTHFDQALALLAARISNNIVKLADGSEFERSMRLQLLGGWVAVLVSALGYYAIAKRKVKIAYPYDGWDLIVHTGNLIGIFVLLLVFYVIGGLHDYRYFAPVVLLSGFLLIARKHWLPLAVLMGVSLLVLFPSITVFGQLAKVYHNQKEVVAIMLDWKTAIGEEVRYDADAPSPWCNTVTFNSSFFTMPYLPNTFEPGIGLSLILRDLDRPLKARYLMLDEVFVAAHPELNTELIFPVQDGALYRNLNAVC